MSKYKYLLFDMDNTLLDFSRAEYLSFERTAKEAGLDYSEELYELYSRINDSLWKKLEVGGIKLEELKIERFRMLLSEIGYSDPEERERIATFMRNRYMLVLGEQGCMIDGAPEVCEKLSGKYDMYILTNGIADIQRSRYAISGLGKYFKEMFISEEIGHTKPERAYFDYVFDKIGDQDKTKYLMIGDSLTSDCDGAIAYGIDICRFNPTGADNKGRVLTYTIKKLTDLYEIL
ncbi:MAG: noncanonical pyrimidine nucleotidase, YjjG family [Ruminococcaceae bacterium]|nr:noncanonical pyrimidine nucleotidase, YjjG family [Oscillospiraceae bacterium]